MPPPQPCRSPACAPEPTQVAYVPNAPISNSFGLKNSGGGGGGGAITCFEDTTGSPAKVAIACDAMATTAKAINLFIGVVLTEIRLFFDQASAQNDGLPCATAAGFVPSLGRRIFPL